MKIDLAIKFGSHEIIIYRKGQGIIAKEPAFLAVTPHGKRLTVKAVGKEAEKLQLSSGSNILVHQPIKNSIVADIKLATTLIRKILEKNIIDKFAIHKINALVAVPCALGYVNLVNLKTVLMGAGINRVTFVQNGVCLREYDETLDPYANCLTVDIGKYTTDVSVLNKFAFSYGRNYQIGGVDMDTSLQTYILDNFELEVNQTLAERIKNKVASLYQNDSYTTSFQGIAEDKTYVEKQISANEVRVAIIGVYNKIFDLILDYVKSLPKAICAEVMKNGIMFSGGSSKIQGLQEYASKKLSLPIIEIDNPVDAVILGCAKLLDKPLKSIVKINL